MKRYRLPRIAVALIISLTFNIVLGILALFVYSHENTNSRMARILDALGAPADVLSNWLVPGHTGVQPLFDMLCTILFCAVLAWLGLTAWEWIQSKRPKGNGPNSAAL